MSRASRRTSALQAGVVVLATATIGGALLAARPAPPASVTAAEASQLVEAIDRLGSAHGLCSDYASNQTMCGGSLQAVAGAHPSSHRVVSQRALDDGSRVVVVYGDLSTGAPYRGFVQVVRETDGSVRAVDPVFWATRTFHDDSR